MASATVRGDHLLHLVNSLTNLGPQQLQTLVEALIKAQETLEKQQREQQLASALASVNNSNEMAGTLNSTMTSTNMMMPVADPAMQIVQYAMPLLSTIKKVVKTGKTAKRPLNSYIAFRSYYGPIFLFIEQKDISGLMTKLWALDPTKGKWAILAKAYSIIRDLMSDQATPLDAFLAICAPYIGIVAPDQYLNTFGWQCTMGPQGGVNLTMGRQLSEETLAKLSPANNIDVQDVIMHALRHGYILATENIVEELKHLGSVNNLMAAGVQKSKPARKRARAPVTRATTIDHSAFDDGLTGSIIPAMPTVQIHAAQHTVQHPQAIATMTSFSGAPTIHTQIANNGPAHFAVASQSVGQPGTRGGRVGGNGAVKKTKERKTAKHRLEQSLAQWQQHEDQEHYDRNMQLAAALRDDFPLEPVSHHVTHPGVEIQQQFNEAGGELAYLASFHPDAGSNITFDPFAGDPFQPFQIDDFSSVSAIPLRRNTLVKLQGT